VCEGLFPSSPFFPPECRRERECGFFFLSFFSFFGIKLGKPLPACGWRPIFFFSLSLFLKVGSPSHGGVDVPPFFSFPFPLRRRSSPIREGRGVVQDFLFLLLFAFVFWGDELAWRGGCSLLLFFFPSDGISRGRRKARPPPLFFFRRVSRRRCAFLLFPLSFPLSEELASRRCGTRRFFFFFFFSPT